MSFKQVPAPVYVWVPEGSTDPGWGVTPPVDPDFGIGSGHHPSQGPIYGGGHPSTGPIYGGGHPGNKPPGRPIVPPHPGHRPPMGGAPPHPWIPGHWEPVDPGWGKPPLWGFFPVDPGWGVDEGVGPDQGLPGGLPGHPSQGLPGSPGHPDQGLPGSGGGTWVPTDPDYGIPNRPCKPRPPIWAWIPAPPDLTKPVEPEEPPPAEPK